ncbi:MAG: ABC transporter permease, partial [Pseudomonadota bacterium]
MQADEAVATDNKGKFLKHVVYVLTANPVTLIAFGLFTLILVAAFLGPLLVPYDPLATNADNALQAPSLAHWFGTDQLGRDVFSRVIVATRLDLFIAFSAVALSFVIGSLAGASAGYWGGWLD